MMLPRFNPCLITFFLCILTAIGLAHVHAEHLQRPEAEFFDKAIQEPAHAQTTLALQLADLKYNQPTFKPITYSLTKGDHFTYRQRSGYQLQDLGNDGTAAKEIFYRLPNQIGAHTGFYVYNLYFKDPLWFTYYDTKSPYTDGSVILARLGTYRFEVCHHRSFNRNWHLGAQLETMLIDKEYIPTTIPGDRHVIAYPFTLLGHYKTHEHKYQLLVSFYRNQHRVRETGGICGPTNTTFLDWLKPKATIANNLAPEDNIETNELRQQYFLYQQLKLSDQIAMYHEAKLVNQFNQFKAPQLSQASNRYLGDYLAKSNPSSLEETTKLKTLGNEFGVKGDIGRLFYRSYYLHKKLVWQPVAPTTEIQITREHYLGLQTRIKLNDKPDYLHIYGTYLWGGHYQLQTAYEGSFFELLYNQVCYKPPFLVQQYQGNYRKWKNNFESPRNQQLYGAIRVTLPYLTIKPHVRFTNLDKLIYFQAISNPKINDLTDETSRPQAIPLHIEPKQNQGYINLLYIGTDLNFTISHFHLDNAFIYSQEQGSTTDLLRMPKFFFTTRFYYARNLYESQAALETGIDLHWHSPYMADGYDPVTQQFYRQNQFKLYSYLLIDLFFNFRIDTFRGFIKLNYFNQHLDFMGGLPGYFVTPFYPGQSRSLDIGIRWSFFD
jgi:hypothetical protein